LDLVVHPRVPLVVGGVNDLLEVPRRLHVVLLKDKAVLQVPHGILCEAVEIALQHELDQVQDLLMVLSDCKKPFNRQVHVELESLTLSMAIHYHDHLLRQLEVRLFELHVPAGRDVEDEAEVDVDDMARVVDQDVPVVAVLYLQKVADDGIRGLALDEVFLRSLVVLGVLCAEFANEMLVEVAPVNLANLVA